MLRLSFFLQKIACFPCVQEVFLVHVVFLVLRLRGALEQVPAMEMIAMIDEETRQLYTYIVANTVFISIWPAFMGSVAFNADVLVHDWIGHVACY